MTTLANRPNTALLVIDFQVGATADAWQRDEVAATIASLVEQARLKHVGVIWVQHSSQVMPIGSPEWAMAPALVPVDGEPIVHKRYGDSFEDTDLEDILADLGVGRLVVCGAQTDACVISTLYGALVRGYDVTLVADAHTTDDRSAYGLPTAPEVIALINAIWQYRTAPGRTTQVVSSNAVEWEPAQFASGAKEQG